LRIVRELGAADGDDAAQEMRLHEKIATARWAEVQRIARNSGQDARGKVVTKTVQREMLELASAEAAEAESEAVLKLRASVAELLRGLGEDAGEEAATPETGMSALSGMQAMFRDCAKREGSDGRS
jgi:hypothetical protein